MTLWRLVFLLLLGVFAFAGLGPPPPVTGPIRSDLIGHAVLNLTLGLVASRAFAYPRPFLYVLAGLSAYGGMIEVIQGFLPGRDPSLEDFAANSLGLGLAWVWAYLVRHARSR